MGKTISYVDGWFNEDSEVREISKDRLYNVGGIFKEKSFPKEDWHYAFPFTFSGKGEHHSKIVYQRLRGFDLGIEFIPDIKRMHSSPMALKIREATDKIAPLSKPGISQVGLSIRHRPLY